MPRAKHNNAWMMPAEIPETTIFMLSEPICFFIQQWPKRGLGGQVTRYFTRFDGDFGRMHYLRHEFDAQAEFLANKMITRPRWALRVINQVENWSRKFMQVSKVLKRSPHRHMTNRQLIALYKAAMHYHRLAHGIGASVSWHADAEKERVTKAIWQELSAHLEQTGSTLSLPEIFSVLTTPRRESLVAKEERDFLRIAIVLRRHAEVRKLFQKAADPVKIIAHLKQFNPVLYLRIQRHHRKYCWLAFQYHGPATKIEEYIRRWQELFHNGDDPRQVLRKIFRDRTQLMARQRQIIRELALTPRLEQLIALAQAMVFIKDFRKDALYHGMYCYESLFKEIGGRLGLSLPQVWAMNGWEIEKALKSGVVDVKTLDARRKFAVAYADRTQYIVYTGAEARAFLRGITMERVSFKNSDILTGTTACPGTAVGTVRVINIPDEMAKMRKGDIMVAHNTNPNLVPAMKKAAALVSESGGLTCHTAIVARELRTPCIVGVAGAAKVLKDGDKVEVNADEGIIRKL
ncbi:MAG: PEP-utilizing enzyme [Patescibacteria group bacterium]|nr:PEP-utilizing enzyme [Patescibacteria group bacterium]MDD5715486.1 PEP-utilizing enzyme [Patescibacteria group bacterium]